MVSKSLFLTLFGLFICLTAAVNDADATIWYVNGNSTAITAEGTTWTFPFHNIQQAINSARFGDEIWVAGGTYVENLLIGYPSARLIHGSPAIEGYWPFWVTEISRQPGILR